MLKYRNVNSEMYGLISLCKLIPQVFLLILKIAVSILLSAADFCVPVLRHVSSISNNLLCHVSLMMISVLMLYLFSTLNS